MPHYIYLKYTKYLLKTELYAQYSNVTSCQHGKNVFKKNFKLAITGNKAHLQTIKR